MLLLFKAISNKARASWGLCPVDLLPGLFPGLRWSPDLLPHQKGSPSYDLALRPCMICMSLSIANENDVCRQSQEVQKRQRHRAKAPVENIEDHYRVNHFLLYIDHSIYIHSRFPQDLKAIFYACVNLRCFTSIVMILSGR